MNTRDAINEILLSLNELPLDISDAIEDIGIAVIVNSQLEITKRKILSRGWFFNKTIIKLVPNTEKYIVIPDSFLSVDGGDDEPSLVVRDHKLFDKEELTFKFDEAKECKIVEDIPFDDIPFTIADYIVQTASFQAYINIIGNSEDIRVRMTMVNEAKINALRENANNIDGSVLDSGFVTEFISGTL